MSRHVGGIVRQEALVKRSQPELSPDESFNQVLDTVRRALYMDLEAEEQARAPVRPRTASYPYVPPINGRPEKSPGAEIALDDFLNWLQSEEKKRTAPKARAEIKKPVERPAVTANTIGIRPGMSIADLKHLRRVFALDNHPDRFLAEEREEATQRMCEANALIDDALNRKKVRA